MNRPKNILRREKIISNYFDISYKLDLWHEWDNIKNPTYQYIWEARLKGNYSENDFFSFVTIQAKDKNTILNQCIIEISIYYFENLKNKKQNEKANY